MAPLILIQGSLNPESKTALVLREAAEALARRGREHDWLDLRDLTMEFCDGRALKEYHPDLQEAYRRIEKASGLIFGMPVYCFSVSGPLKNFIDITAVAMENKVAGIICNAGGKASYMALGDLARILAFESRVLTVQPAVYTCYEDFEDNRLANDTIRQRVDSLVEALLRHIEPADDS